ncbi:hypothetical protein GCM10023229_24450 [Flavisolibacter ginsenosidimutans]
MKAQSKNSPVGEYYLRGVMETASGFTLDSDSSFQFFFSYGALDRYGKGHWRVQNDTLVLDSEAKPLYDFKLLVANKIADDKITVQIKESDASLFRYFHCRLFGNGKMQEGITNEKGIVVFRSQMLDSLELAFEFCPEKKSVFVIKKTLHNHFVFAPEPWLTEVFFQNFRLHFTPEGLEGGHPLSNKSSFRYEKQQ